jgi:nitrite reductase (NO-forming)
MRTLLSVMMGLIVLTGVTASVIGIFLPESQAQGTREIKRFTFIADEMEVQVAPDNPLHPGGIMYKAMVFNGTIPGPVVSVQQGDTVEFTLTNEGTVIHSLDFHAGFGPSKALSGNVAAGETKTWTLDAVNAGVFLYHCGADGLNGVWEHIANGMYGGIIVHSENEKPAQEFVVVFGEIYNSADSGPFTNIRGEVGSFDIDKLWNNSPDLILTNGKAHRYFPSVGSSAIIPLNNDAETFDVKPGELTRWYIVNAGPNEYVAFHFIGGIISVIDTRLPIEDVDDEGASWPEGPGDYEFFNEGPGPLVSVPILPNDETWTIPPGSGSVIETVFPEEGVYVGLDHNMSHVLKGAAFAVQASASLPQARLTIQSELDGEAVSGVDIIVLHGDQLIEGQSPGVFDLDTGETYEVEVMDTDEYVFDHWSDDGSEGSQRSLALQRDTTLTAVFVKRLIQESTTLTLNDPVLVSELSYTVSGRLIDSEGAGIAEKEIRLTASQEVIDSTITGFDGTFQTQGKLSESRADSDSIINIEAQFAGTSEYLESRDSTILRIEGPRFPWWIVAVATVGAAGGGVVTLHYVPKHFPEPPTGNATITIAVRPRVGGGYQR